MRKFLSFVVGLTMFLALSGCNNYMADSDPIQSVWVSDGIYSEGCKLVFNFESEAVGELWLEKDKKLYGTKTPFIYTRSMIELKLTTAPIGGKDVVVKTFTINSLSSTAMSLTDIETKVTTTFTKK